MRAKHTRYAVLTEPLVCRVRNKEAAARRLNAGDMARAGLLTSIERSRSATNLPPHGYQARACRP